MRPTPHTWLTAALMALQALVLYLLAHSNGQAADIYRCGASYQSTPCDEARPATGLRADLRDPRHTRQVQHARETERRQRAWTESTHRSNEAFIKQQARRPAVAIALDCRRHGDRPFEARCRTPQDARDRRGDRVARSGAPAGSRPFTARAGTQEGVWSGAVATR